MGYCVVFALLVCCDVDEHIVGLEFARMRFGVGDVD